MKITAVLVHYGPVEPTVAVVRTVLPLVDECVVAVNDATVRPAGLPAGVLWEHMGRNLGYGAAFGRAVSGRDSDVFVLLNNDVDIAPESFRRCVAVLADDGTIGVVGPLLRFPDGRLQSGAGRLTGLGRIPRARFDPGPALTDCDWVTGAAMFLRGELIRAVGVDGSYFLGYEDTDLCVRAREAGYRVVCHGGAPAVHYGSQVISGPRWSYYAPRNRVWFARAHFGRYPAAVVWIREVALLPRVLLADLLKRRDLRSTRLALLAVAHAWLRKPTAAEGPRPDEPLAGRVMRW